MRRAAAVAAIAVLVLGLLVLLIPRFISLDALKPRIVAALEERTGRRVALAGIRLALFPGIGVRVTGVTVSGDPGRPGEHLLSVPEAEIRLAILPLLNGRAVFTTIILRRPAILFREYADGTHSATEIANRLAREEPAPSPPGGKEKVAVRLSTVRIEDAAFSLRVEEPGGKETRWDVAPLSFSLSGIGERRHDFSLAMRLSGAVRGEIAFAGRATLESGPVVDPAMFDVAGKGKLFGQPVALEGKMSAPVKAPAEVDLGFVLSRVAMDEIPKTFGAPPAWLKRLEPEGRAVVKGRVVGNLQAMGFELDADLAQAGWTVGPEIKKFIDTPCDVVIQGHRFPDLLVVSNAEVRFPPLLLIANAAYAPSTGAREWRASARISSLKEFARSRGGELARYHPKGRVTASGRGKKASASAPDAWAVSVDLGDVGFHSAERRYDFREMSGHVEADPAGISFLPLAGLFNGQRFTLRGPVALGGAPRGELEFRMGYLDVDALFPSSGATDGKEKGRGKARHEEEKGAGKGEGISAFSARAKVRVDAGKVRGLEFTDLSGLVTYEKGVLLLDSVRARLFGGEATVSGRIGFAVPSPDFRVKVAARDISAAKLLGRNTSLGEFLSGKASFAGEIGGGVKDFADFARTAAGKGSFRVAGGKIKNVDLLATAASLSGLSGLLPGVPAGAGRVFPGETAFSDLSADFRVEGGKIRTDALRIASDRLGLSGNAAIGFDRTLDFRGVLRLSRELSEKAEGQAGKFLRGPGGRVEIPLVMSGPLTAPAVAIDAEALAAGLAGKVLRGVMERLTGPPPGEEKAREAPKGPEESPERKEPRQGIEGLFEKILPRR